MTKKIARLHYITQHTDSHRHAGLAELACKGGVKWVQLRVKGQSHESFLQEARKTRAVCKKYGSLLIINDNVAIAKEAGADGVHLGKEDMDPVNARKILGDQCIIGATANTVDDVIRLSTCGVDYIGLGPFRFTATKINLSPLLGLEGYTKIADASKKLNIELPLIAIGGIKKEDVAFLMNTGIHGIAVSSAINLAADPVKSTCEFLAALDQQANGTRQEDEITYTIV